jgi:hypothetical protein
MQVEDPSGFTRMEGSMPSVPYPVANDHKTAEMLENCTDAGITVVYRRYPLERTFDATAPSQGLAGHVDPGQLYWTSSPEPNVVTPLMVCEISTYTSIGSSVVKYEAVKVLENE